MKIAFTLMLFSFTTAQYGLAGFYYFSNQYIIYNVKSLTKKESLNKNANFSIRYEY